MKHFLRNVATTLTVFRTDGETVFYKEVIFGQIASTASWIKKGKRASYIVIKRSSTIDRFIGRKSFEGLIAKGLGGITHHKRTKLGSVLKGNRMRIRGQVKR
jgi:hypothetical protein